MDKILGKDIIFVFDLRPLDKWNNTFCNSLRAKVEHLPVQEVNAVSTSLDPLYLGPNRNFRSMGVRLAANGLSISGAFLRLDGKVVFTTGKEVDASAELLFMALTRSSGWLTVRYENLDGSIVFASKNARFLSETVKGKSAMGTSVEVKRPWSAREVVLFPSKRKTAYPIAK